MKMYQANKSICIENKVMFCRFDIPYKRVHPTYLREGKFKIRLWMQNLTKKEYVV